MNMNEMAYYALILRTVYAVVITVVVAMVIYWCIRTSQFSRQDRLSALPLEIEDGKIEVETDQRKDKKNKNSNVASCGE